MKRAANAQKKRRFVLEKAPGYRGRRSRFYCRVKEQVIHSGVYVLRDRRTRKDNLRHLWIQRINATARVEGLTCNRFIQGLGLAGVETDRCMPVELAVNEPAGFKVPAEAAHKTLPEDVNAPKA